MSLAHWAKQNLGREFSRGCNLTCRVVVVKESIEREVTDWQFLGAGCRSSPASALSSWFGLFLTVLPKRPISLLTHIWFVTPLFTLLVEGPMKRYTSLISWDFCRNFLSAQWTNVLMQGHCNQNGYFGYVSGNLVSIQKSFYKLTAIPQAWPRIYFKSI